MNSEDDFYMIGSTIEWVKQEPEKMITSEIVNRSEDEYTIQLNIPIPNIKVFHIDRNGVVNGKP